MNRFGKASLLIVLVVGLAAGLVVGWNMSQPVAAQPAAMPAVDAGSHYSVVETEGTHLIVTDNKTNTLYYYSIEKDAEIGSAMKLRGSVDLTQVGTNTITPKVFFKKK